MVCVKYMEERKTQAESCCKPRAGGEGCAAYGLPPAISWRVSGRWLQLGFAALLPSRTACVPALSEAAPARRQHNACLHSPSDWRSRRSPCLLSSGSQVREHSQLLFLAGQESFSELGAPLGSATGTAPEGVASLHA